MQVKVEACRRQFPATVRRVSISSEDTMSELIICRGGLLRSRGDTEESVPLYTHDDLGGNRFDSIVNRRTGVCISDRGPSIPHHGYGCPKSPRTLKLGVAGHRPGTDQCLVNWAGPKPSLGMEIET